MNPRIKPHSDRIGYKDYKGQFKIVFDGMPSKEVCNLTLTNSLKRIAIGRETYDLDKVSTVEISKFRKKLVDAAFKHACEKTFKFKNKSNEWKCCWWNYFYSA